MKTIGLLGGMSWESSVHYYTIINSQVKAILGGYHSAKCVMYSVDFAEIEKLQRENNWDKMNEILIDASLKLEKAGAEFLVICTNTMHKGADEIEKNINIPLLHIADACAENIKQRNLNKVALLGTKFTMEEDFYKKRIEQKYNISVIIPEGSERNTIHGIIFDELVLGKINCESRKQLKNIINNLVNNGAEGVILGCTELPMLVSENEEIPIFDTTKLHSSAAVEYALGNINKN